MEGLNKLASVLEAQEAGYMAAFAKARDGRIENCECETRKIDTSVAVRDTRYAILSRCVGLGMGHEVSPAHLETMVHLYHKHDMTAVVDISSLAHPSLLEALAAFSYTISGYKHVWFRALGKEPLNGRMSPGLSAQQVKPDDVEVWAKTMESAYAAYGMGYLGDRELLELQTDLEGSYCFAVTQDAEIAGGGVLAVQNNLGLFRGAATLSGFSGRGVYSSLIRARLQVASAVGCSMVAVHLSPGHPCEQDYLEHKFQLAYTRISIEIPAPEAA